MQRFKYKQTMSTDVNKINYISTVWHLYTKYKEPHYCKITAQYIREPLQFFLTLHSPIVPAELRNNEIVQYPVTPSLGTGERPPGGQKRVYAHLTNANKIERRQTNRLSFMSHTQNRFGHRCPPAELPKPVFERVISFSFQKLLFCILAYRTSVRVFLRALALVQLTTINLT